MSDPRTFVGLDVDGVLYRFGKGARKVMREVFGVEISEDVWFVEELVTPEQWAYVWSDEGVARMFFEGRAFPGAVKFAQQLHELCRVRILTAIPANAQQVRRLWLTARGIPYDELVFVEAPKDPGQLIGTNGRLHASKSAITPHCDVYIDDSADNCVDLATNTAAGLIILVNHSWNTEDDHKIAPYPQIERLRGWDAIMRRVIEFDRVRRSQHAGR